MSIVLIATVELLSYGLPVLVSRLSSTYLCSLVITDPHFKSLLIHSLIVIRTEIRVSKINYSSGSADSLLALINAGANVAAKDKDGLTGEGLAFNSNKI